MADKLVLTAKQARVIEIMRAEDAPMFPVEIAEKDSDLFTKGARSVSPLMNSLGCGEKGKGLVRGEKAEYTTVDAEGKEVNKQLMQYALTDAGKSVDFDVKAA